MHETANEPILRVEGLYKYFETKKSLFTFDKKVVKALDGVSFEIHKGE